MNEVSIQRDALRTCLDELCDRIRSGAYNGLFPAKNPRRTDGPTVCGKKVSRHDAIWSCGGSCRGCEGIGKGCVLSFEEKQIFETLETARSVLRDTDAEMPSVKPSDFPVYDPDRFTYEATDRWIARAFYRFAVGYALRRSNAEAAEWARAFDDLLALGLDHIGRDGKSVWVFFRRVREIEARTDDRETLKSEAENLHKELPEAVRTIDEVTDHALDHNESKANTVDNLVCMAVLLRMEYQFGKNYPGADEGVYDDAFGCLIDIALRIAGLWDDGCVRREDGESEADYVLRKARRSAEGKERCYAFMAEPDGLTRTSKES